MLIDIIKNRYSIRKFNTEKMPSFEDIRDILEAGRLAPSFLNLQPWHFIVIKDNNMKNLLYKLSDNQPHILEAPVIIACLADLNVFDYENYRGFLEKQPDITSDKVQYFLNNKALNPASLSQEAVRQRGLEELTYAISYMTLMANEKGLGTCIIGGIGNEFTQAKQDIYAVVRMELELPKDVCLGALLLVGYSGDETVIPTKNRKSFEEIVSFEKYSLPETNN